MIRKLLPVALAAAFALPAAADDDFYVQRLREARRFVEARDYREAIDSFRIAAFGMMNEPPRYEQALAGLVLAEESAGRPDQAKETLQRIVQVETRFPGSFDAAVLSPGDRKSVEQLLVGAISQDVLRGAGRFSRLVKSEEEKLAELPSAERHRAYERRAREKPDAGAWDLANARLFLEEGSARQAAKFAERALEAGPASDEARLLHARALAALSRWKEALAEFERVPAASRDPDGNARAEYGVCLYHVGKAEEARAALAGLPPEVAARPAVAAALKDLEAKAPRKNGTESEPVRAAAESAAAPSLVANAREALARHDLAAAETDLAAALKSEPGNRAARLLFGELQYLRSNWSAGAATFQKLEPFDPAEAKLEFYQAVCLYNIGRFAEARAALKRALPGISSSPTVEKYKHVILEGGKPGSP